jgi:hypothetical protein
MQSNHESERDEDFELEVVDIPADEVRTISGALVDLGYRLISRLRQFKVTFTPGDTDHEGEDDQSDFDVSFVDLPAAHSEHETETQVSSSENEPQTSWRWLYVGKIRNISPLSLLFLLVIAPLSGSSLYQSISPNLQTTYSSVTVTLVPNSQPTQKDASDFITVGQLQLSIWPGLSSDSSTIVLPGIALGHATKPGGPATWNAAPMPSNCSADQSVDPLYTGHISLLVAGSSEPAMTVHLPAISSRTLDSWSGWEIPILIGVKFHLVGPITITLSNQYDGPAPSFSGVFDAHQRSSFSFDPNNVTPGVRHISTKGRNFWMLHMYVAGAGCYIVHASWYGGFRQTTLSAGR